MKILSIAILLMIVPFCGIGAQTSSGKKVLVTYFSVPETDGVDASTGASRIIKENKVVGTTEYIAQLIANSTGGYLSEIKTVNPYPTHSHKDLIDFAKKEAESKINPQIANKIANFNDYDVVFIGYPNWWYDMPRVIYTLLNDYDFSDKTIILFCTHGGSGFSQSVETIKNLEKNATVINMPAISRNRVENAKESIEKWLKNNDLSK